MQLPINADKIIGMTQPEAVDWIKSHNSDAQLYIIYQNGTKITAPVHSNAIYAVIEDGFITSYSIV